MHAGSRNARSRQPWGSFGVMQQNSIALGQYRSAIQNYGGNLAIWIEHFSGLFNSSLEGNARRAIDLHEGDEVDGDAFKTLIRAAVALNRSSAR